MGEEEAPSWQARQEQGWMTGKFFSGKAKSFRERGIRRCSLQSLSHCSHKHPGGQREENAPWDHLMPSLKWGSTTKSCCSHQSGPTESTWEEFHQWHLTAWGFLRDCSFDCPSLFPSSQGALLTVEVEMEGGRGLLPQLSSHLDEHVIMVGLWHLRPRLGSSPIPVRSCLYSWGPSLTRHRCSC